MQEWLRLYDTLKDSLTILKFFFACNSVPFSAIQDLKSSSLSYAFPSFFSLSLSIALILVCPTLSLLMTFSICLVCPFNSSLYPIIFSFYAYFSPSLGLLFLSFISSIYSQSLALPSQPSAAKPCVIGCRHLCKSPSCARGFLWTRPVGSLSLCVLEAVLAHLEKQGTLLTQRDCPPRGVA